MAICYFILSVDTQNMKFYWFVMNIKKFVLPILFDDKIDFFFFFFLLRMKILGFRSEWVNESV